MPVTEEFRVYSGQELCGDAQRAITRCAVRGGGATLTPCEGTGRLSPLDLNASCADHGFQEILSLTFFLQKITFLHTHASPIYIKTQAGVSDYRTFGMRIFGILRPPANDVGKLGPPKVTLLLLRGVPAGEAPLSALRWLPVLFIHTNRQSKAMNTDKHT